MSENIDTEKHIFSYWDNNVILSDNFYSFVCHSHVCSKKAANKLYDSLQLPAPPQMYRGPEQGEISMHLG